MERSLKKSVSYTIRIREEDVPKIEAARNRHRTVSALLIKGAEIANGETAKPAVK